MTTTDILPTTQPSTSPSKGSGLAIAAFVVGIISLLLCWVPIVNNIVFFLGVIGLLLAVPAFLGARKGKRGGKGLSLAALILNVVALVGVIASQAFYSKVIDDVSDSVDQSFEDAAADRGTEQADAELEAAEQANVLAIGQSAEIGSYTVTVTGVTPNADALIMEANEFNDPATHAYVLVNATVTYNGTDVDEGTPDIDLSAAIVGSDNRQYDSSAASVVTPKEDEGYVKLTTGGTSEIDFAMDVPAAALAGGKVLIEETFNLGADERAYWPAG